MSTNFLKEVIKLVKLMISSYDQSPSDSFYHVNDYLW